MYIQTSTLPINSYNDTSFILCPPYSKILHVCVRRDDLIITYSSDLYVDIYGSKDNWKKFNFLVINGLQHNNTNIKDEFDYFNTIRVEESDFIDYYHIFIQEVKSVAEMRDVKIESIVE